MVFPYEFAKMRHDYDFITPILNRIANAGVIAVGGMSVAAITFVALKKLGFTHVALKTITAIPLSIGMLGVAATIVTSGLLLLMLQQFITRK